MRYIKAKTVEQQDIQATHRIRSELMRHRTAKANQIRGLVTEYGLIAPLQMASLRVAIPHWLEEPGNGLTDRFRALLHALWDDLLTLPTWPNRHNYCLTAREQAAFSLCSRYASSPYS